MERVWRLPQVLQLKLKFGPKVCLRQERYLISSRLLSSDAKREVKLPKLPVPTLQQTLDKYLRTVEPHLSIEQFENTKRIVAEFSRNGGIGERLQLLLVKKYNETENWLADWWLKYSYLAFRKPLLVYSSPGMVLPNFDCKSAHDVIVTAARIILAVVDYKQAVDEGRLPVEMMGKAVLDMTQHGLMLGTCRIPQDDRDFLTYLPGNNHPKHVIVAHNNHFFKVDVYDENYRPYSEAILVNLLADVVNKSPILDVPVGILTTEHRDKWAAVYKNMRQSKINSDSFAEIQKCLFVICLDCPNLASKDKNFLTRSALQMIHGNGSNLNGGNRWYDKTVQFIVGTKGEFGISYEHSPAEGPPIAQLSDKAVDCIFGNTPKLNFSDVSSPTTLPVKLSFELSNETLEAIDDAKNHLDELVNNLEMFCFVFERFGKNYIKSRKLSPDSFIQMGLQLAFYRLHGVVGAAYETASTRMYAHGRTETIRSASVQSLAFCKAMLDQNTSAEVKKKSIYDAIESHKLYVSDAVKGYGVDRHLLGLKLLATENQMEVPDIFKDIGFSKSSSFRLSTSQVSARHRSFMCYGPLVPDGYGCCYNPRDDDMIFGISSFNECKETSAILFHQALQQSLIDMQNILGFDQMSKL